AGSRRRGVELRDTAEHVQRDAADGYVLVQRREGVRELVQEDRCEEEHGGQGAVQPVGGRGARGQDVRKIARRKTPRHETEDHEPAGVDPYRDPPDPEQLDHLRTRVNSSVPSPGTDAGLLTPLTTPISRDADAAASRRLPPPGSANRTPSDSSRPVMRVVRRARPAPVARSASI